MEDIERRIGSLEQRVEKLEDNLGTLRADVAEIKASLSSLATKQDLATIVNGLLHDALFSVPASQSILWSAVSALAAAAAVGLSIILATHK